MDIVLRAAIIFLFVFVLTRVLGRRELNSLEPFDLILLVVTGDLVQQGVTQSDNSVTGTTIVIGTIVLCTSLLEWLSWRFPKLRRTIDGQPVILVEHGQPIERNLKRERLTVAELEAEARLQQMAGLSAVRLAVLETNGQISFLEQSK
jgi:uncharacterized membrane protein YcaP (DUF421 family)